MLKAVVIPQIYLHHINKAHRIVLRTLTQRYASTTTSKEKNQHYDVVIVGGGVVGSALAKRLTNDSTGISVAVIEPRRPAPFTESFSKVDYESVPMARAYALSPSSITTLGEDILEKLENVGRVTPYEKMQVWESNGPASLHFKASDIIPSAEGASDNDTESKENMLGYMIEDAPLVSALWETLESRNVDMISPAVVKSIVAPGTSNSSLVQISCEDMETKASKDITTHLLVAADGANSSTRKVLGMPTVGFGYGRRAITCVVELSSSMNHTAFQRFFPNGPVALLPMWTTTDSSSDSTKFYANVVWSTTPSHAAYLTKLTPQDFLKELNEALQMGPTNSPPLFSNHFQSLLPPVIGNAIHGFDLLLRSINNGITMSQWNESHPFIPPPPSTQLVSKIMSFDLQLSLATNFVQPRIALIGDAAHTIHPMAGQGLNLGLGDVETLSHHIRTALESGMDPGDSLFLDRYGAQRRNAALALMSGIQGLHMAFGTEVAPILYARSLGMNVVNAVSPIRKLLVNYAAHGTFGRTGGSTASGH